MNRPSLILLVGIPGSGKTTYAEKYIPYHPKHAVHLSSDNVRKELYSDESIQGDPSEVFSIMQKRAIEALNNGNDVLYDATNITRRDRAGIIGVCPKHVKIECHIIWAPIEICIERDSARKRTVGKVVIDKMLKRFQAPYYDEGIHEIKVVFPDDFNRGQYFDNYIDAMNIPHDNPHHTLNIEDHCFHAALYIRKHYCNDFMIEKAAEYHDIGKPYVKAFIDSQGNTCEVAHYYQHQCVGAWISYGMPNVTPYVAWLISVHMDPFLNTKYYNKLPVYLKKQVDLLHEADLNAH